LGDSEADLFMGLFTSPVKQYQLNFVSGFQEFASPVKLDLQIVLADFVDDSELGCPNLLIQAGELGYDLPPLNLNLTYKHTNRCHSRGQTPGSYKETVASLLRR
jgi:hypothetical protein